MINYFKYAVERKNVTLLKVTNLNEKLAFLDKLEAMKK